ncbi:hypothetical protein PR048_003130 [Dryococelus australis]|uniref:HAT C-terminal dimerisation domain-containing protein n=1 Tax=Dryococelus australis TaxID=614101 RepID=A0ABQ9IM56_9NEOP|nr:hypothetical protein PR048_003130 [Dryococelus australis]
MAIKLDIELRKPRICPNYAVSSVEDYYRIFVYIPLLDHIVGDLKERYLSEVLGKLQLLKIKGEVSHWQQKWSSEKNCNAVLPITAVTALEACDKHLYSFIHTLLQILCTLPVSNARAERSFSTLRLAKTRLRSTMLEYRLMILVLLHTQKVIERFSKIGKHCMVL